MTGLIAPAHPQLTHQQPRRQLLNRFRIRVQDRLKNSLLRFPPIPTLRRWNGPARPTPASRLSRRSKSGGSLSPNLPLSPLFQILYSLY